MFRGITQEATGGSDFTTYSASTDAFPPYPGSFLSFCKWLGTQVPGHKLALACRKTSRSVGNDQKFRTSQSGAAAADDVRDMGQVANVIVSDVYFQLLPARRSCTTHTSLVAVVTG